VADTSVSFKCLNCGAPLEYKPGAKGEITCEYCGSKFTTQALDEYYKRQEEQAAQAAAAQEEKWKKENAEAAEMGADEPGWHTFTCSSCGAELICDENTIATECVYCGNPNMIAGRFAGMLRPDYVIPFAKTKKEAVEALKEFYKGKKLLPDAFTANNRVEEIQGLYVPFWIFDAQIEASASYKAESDSVVMTPDEIITTISTYNVQRTGRMTFERIPADGSEKMDDDFMDSIEPFDYSKMVPFTTAYLAGYLADKYDVEAEKCAERVDPRILSTAQDMLQSTVNGYDRFDAEGNAAVRKLENCVKYVLAPVWILTTRYQDKPYTFIMNGQTGKMVGRLPWDKGKAMKYPAIAAAIAFVLIFIIARLMM